MGSCDGRLASRCDASLLSRENAVGFLGCDGPSIGHMEAQTEEIGSVRIELIAHDTQKDLVEEFVLSHRSCGSHWARTTSLGSKS